MARIRHWFAWVALALLLVGLVGGIYLTIRYLERTGPGFVANRLLLPLLSSAVVVLVLGLAGVLIRNLVRLIMDRKRGILGSKLQTKLVFFFLALVLPPSLVLFYGSATIIKMTVEAMLKMPVENITQDSQKIVNDWSDYLQARCLLHAERIADDVSSGSYLGEEQRSSLQALLEQRLEREELQLILVTSGKDPLARVGDERVAQALRQGDASELLGEAVEEVMERGHASTRLDYLGSGLMAHAVAPIHGAAGSTLPVGVVVAGIYLPHDLAARLRRISTATEGYRQFRAQRRDLIALYLSLIALIFLVTVFVATWMGFYLSRRITVPVHELAAATREISAGNLGVRVRTDVGDEVGTLVDSFNEMASQLQESQEIITLSTAELRRSNRALDERRRYIEVLLSDLSTGVLSLDVEGKVTTANPAVERILGIQIRPGNDARSCLSVEGLEPLRDLVDEAIRAGGDAVSRDLALSRKGESISVVVQVSSLSTRAAESLGTLIMMDDLTDLLRAQKAMAWREVARQIAHEIKNPLTPIQLASQRLRKKFQEKAPDLSEVVPEATASIEKEVGALKDLVDEFSGFARMPEVTPRTVDFRQVMDSVMALYRGLPRIGWEVETDASVETVRVDAEQMRRALINLIDNAVAAMDGEGTIRISARAYAGPGSLRIEVADTGPGISPVERDKMFVPYFSTKGRGSGLGLAIVHRVVKDHRGSIRVEENEPHGARFVIEIPA